MKFRQKLKRVSLLTIMAASMIACSRGPVIQDFSNTASPNEEYVKLDKDINEAFDNQIYILAPSNFKMAKKSLKGARKSFDKQANAKETLHIIAECRAYLNRSIDFAKLSHANLKEVILAREQAILAGAPNLFSKDFRDAEESFEDVTSDIEKNELKSAIEKKSSLQLEYLDLELRSIKQANLGQARATIAQAIKEGAKEFAPRSLAMAEKNVQDFDSFITANRHESDKIKSSMVETQKSADHLLKITRDSKSGKKTSSEELALRMESEQEKVVDKQAQLMDKDYQLRNKENQLVKNESTIKSLATQNISLESEQELNKRFEKARNEFSESEAEVYKQGNTLIIRLKGLEFPAAQAVLNADNFKLLAKVQKVLRSLGKSAVTIEGHTDSAGGKAFNQKLSSERALAVREYLLSNGVGEVTNIKAVGFDYQKPLATNKTSDGRAKNRRVDVLISPESSKEFVR